ncbi:RTA1-domain-containing protein [Lindgomyces ingoldianus]|uniref:RTA1-domain-containing protein n=1 Tax=Lindgomyces ingoldianus TaxID=673940 RepID=A0ACB6QNT9_9PLEO|nr:RTA1-domain-containing protein [Lindgomyces ingoldianus]KAF2468674.1 RTA1-domain-containing protein [Lindgomyces ingoldianus]
MAKPVDHQYLIFFGPNANCTFDICTASESVYGYRPSLAANITFIVLFSVANLIHVVQGFRWTTWRFTWLMILGCAHEITGYIARIKLYYNPWAFVPFLIQIITITQAPVFYCAAIYITLGRCIAHFGSGLARFPPKYLYRIFLPCDVVSLVLQGVGGAMSASSSGDSRTGVNIAMAGLIFQVITLFAFCSLLGDFFFRFILSKKGKMMTIREKVFLGFISLATLAILIRCIFRAHELKQGYHGEAVRREDLFIGLEGVLIVVSVFSLCVGHPGLIFKDDGMKYRTVDGIEPPGESGELLKDMRTEYNGGRTTKTSV